MLEICSGSLHKSEFVFVIYNLDTRDRIRVSFGTKPRHTGPGQGSHYSKVPSNLLHTTLAQSKNLNRQFCRLREQGSQSDQVGSGMKLWTGLDENV